MRNETFAWIGRGVGFALGVGLVPLAGPVAVQGIEVIQLVFLAVLLGAAMEPVIGSIRDRTGMRRGFAILLVYGVFLALVTGLALFVVPAAISELGPAIGRLPTFLEGVRTSTANLRPP